MSGRVEVTGWRVEIYDSAWGGWREVEGGIGLTKSEAEDHARRLNEQSTFKYRANLTRWTNP